MPRNYNIIYSQLVEDKNDIVGHIAYALYKADKVEFIENFKKENAGKEPIEVELKPFHDISRIQGNLARYKLEAISIIRTFTADIIDDMTGNIRSDIITNQKVIFLEAIEPLKPHSKGKLYFHGTMQSLLGAFAFTCIIALIVLIISISKKEHTVTIGGDNPISIKETTISTSNTTKTILPE